MENFTIHIFGHGETQINSKDLSVKVKTTDLTSAQPLIDAIWLKKPENSEAEQEYHVIHCLSYEDVRYVSKNSFSLKNHIDLKPLIDALITELKQNNDMPTQKEAEVKAVNKS